MQTYRIDWNTPDGVINWREIEAIDLADAREHARAVPVDAVASGCSVHIWAREPGVNPARGSWRGWRYADCVKPVSLA